MYKVKLHVAKSLHFLIKLMVKYKRKYKYEIKKRGFLKYYLLSGD